MTFKLLSEICWIWHLRYLMEGRRHKSFLWQAEIPSSGPEATTTREDRAQQIPHGTCFKCSNTGPWAKNCPKPHSPLVPCPNFGQSGNCTVDCTILSCQSRSVLQVLPPQENPSDLQHLASKGCCPKTSASNKASKFTMEKPRLTVQVAGKSLSFLIYTEATWSILTAVSDKTHLS